MKQAKPVKHRGKSRIRPIDEHGNRLSMVFNQLADAEFAATSAMRPSKRLPLEYVTILIAGLCPFWAMAATFAAPSSILCEEAFHALVQSRKEAFDTAQREGKPITNIPLTAAELGQELGIAAPEVRKLMRDRLTDDLRIALGRAAMSVGTARKNAAAAPKMPEDFTSKIIARVAAVEQEKDVQSLSLKELASEFDVPRSAVRRWMNGLSKDDFERWNKANTASNGKRISKLKQPPPACRLQR